MFTIFGETTRDGESICILYNYCVPAETWEKAEHIYYPFFPKRSPKPSSEHSTIFEKLKAMLGISQSRPQKEIALKDPKVMIENAKNKMAAMGVSKNHDQLPHQVPNLKSKIL